MKDPYCAQDISVLLMMSLIDQSLYSIHFNTRDYLQICSGAEQSSSFFRSRDFFLKYSPKWDKSSAKLLDFSGGALITNYISAPPFLAEIVHSAYTEDERKELELWLNDADGAHNWNPFIKNVVSVIEGQEGDSAWQERVAQLRSKIKVVSCNIHDDHPIGLELEQSHFSVICTSLALEAACKSYAEFKKGVKKLVNLLRLGGYIAFILAENSSFYCVGDRKWAALFVSLTQLKEAVEEAGCVVLMTDRDPIPIHELENQLASDQTASCFLAAYKVKN